MHLLRFFLECSGGVMWCVFLALWMCFEDVIEYLKCGIFCEALTLRISSCSFWNHIWSFWINSGNLQNFPNFIIFDIIFGTFGQQPSSYHLNLIFIFLKLKSIPGNIVLQFCLGIPWCPERSIWSWKCSLFRWNLDVTLRAPRRRGLRR